jgi:nitrite reductase (NADH) large subunit
LIRLYQNVLKRDVTACIQSGEAKSVADVRKCTKAGNGCGGCVPLITNLCKVELGKAGVSVSNNMYVF